MTYSNQFIEGFDKYGEIGFVFANGTNPGGANTSTPTASRFTGEWTRMVAVTGGGGGNIRWSFGLNEGLSVSGPVAGASLSIRHEMSGIGSSLPCHTRLSKTLDNNYPRSIGGATFKIDLSSTITSGVAFSDGDSPQVSIGFDSAGRIVAYRGDFSTGTLLGTSTQSMTDGSVHCIEWDVTIHNSSGAISVWIDGVATSIALTSQNTRSTLNDYFNVFDLKVQQIATTPVSTVVLNVDNVYLYLFNTAGTVESPLLSNPIIETQFPISDASPNDWDFVTTILGDSTPLSSTTTAGTANRIMLRQYIPEASGSLTVVNFIPGTTSGTAGFKPAVYSDSSGVPDTLIETGSAVTGSVAGTALPLPLTTPVPVTAGTPIWIGWCTNTAIASYKSDTLDSGVIGTITYASAPPSTAPSVTVSQISYVTWGTVVSVSGNNWSVVNENPSVDSLSYLQATSVDDEDLYNFPPLTHTALNIHTMAVKGRVTRVDAGAATIDLETKSGSTTSSGSSPNQTPSTQFGYLSTHFDVDPQTGVAWTTSGLNSSVSGIKKVS